MSKKLIKIKSVKLVNFKLYEDITFDFNGKNFILVSGSNGFGKSTVLDAIEWCITGEIKRISNNFKRRNTNQIEQNRADNNNGIIKNKNAGKEDIISVTMEVIFGDDVLTVERSQIEDKLDAKSNFEFISETSEQNKDELITAFSTSSFYNYNVCDTYKNYEFLTTNRKNVLEMFREFIRERPEIEIVTTNLKNVVEKLNEKKQSKSKLLTPEADITNIQKKIQNLKSDIKLLDYPNSKIYDSESTNLDNLDKKELSNQLSVLTEHAYKFALVKVQGRIEYLRTQELMTQLDKNIELVRRSSEELYLGFNSNYHLNNYASELREQIELLKVEYDKIDKLNKIKSINEFITNHKLNSSKQLQNTLSNLDVSIKEYNSLTKQIDDTDKGNKIIKVLADIVASKEEFLAYRNEGNTSCPVCGEDSSFEKFVEISQIGLEAEKYLSNNKSILANLKREQRDIQEKSQESKYLVKQILREMIGKLIETKEKDYEVAKAFYSEFKTLFEFANVNNIDINTDILSSLVKSRESEKSKCDKVLKTLVEKQLLDSLFALLNFETDFNYDEIKSMLKLESELEPYIKNAISIDDFQFKLYQVKRACIKAFLDNHELTELETNHSKMLDENRKVNEQTIILDRQISKANGKINEFERLSKELEKKELENVGPFLEGIFSKIVKHSSINGIRLTRDNSVKGGGIVLQDNDKSNLMNILSEGQLGVMMMSYYFANMYRRRESNNIKVYMMDDVTNTLDDINLLSFIDMIKYILSDEERVIDQFFFSTCDENLERLFIHKLKSFNIPGLSVKFNSFGKYKSENI